jgi:D-glycero-alpha-D-manno-heptose-7-phosphate kinase
MIITRTPFRISFAGGGSDLPKFYHRKRGAVVSVTIDKYMYIMLRENFAHDQILLKYSKSELVNDATALIHPIFRQLLMDYGLNGLEIALSADVPAGTGLASSSALTVGLHQNIGILLGRFATKENLARLACNTEINELKRPIGKQDQYAAAYGGLNFIEFHSDERVTVENLYINRFKREQLEDSLVLIYTGLCSHSAERLLSEVNAGIDEEEHFRQITDLVVLAHSLRDELVAACNPIVIGEIMHAGWMKKRELALGVTNETIDEIYRFGLKHGAVGGKLLGAGGAGFILFACAPGQRDYLLGALSQFQSLPFRFEMHGSSVVYVSDDAMRNHTGPARNQELRVMHG